MRGYLLHQLSGVLVVSANAHRARQPTILQSPSCFDGEAARVHGVYDRKQGLCH
jgi:hypothetical protein